MQSDPVEVSDLKDKYRLRDRTYYDRDGLLAEFLPRVMPAFKSAGTMQDYHNACDRTFSAWCRLFDGAAVSPESVDKQWGFVYARFLVQHKQGIQESLP
jgi:hypothetical protein